MNTSLIALGIALFLGLGLVITLGLLHLLFGGMAFLFSRPSFTLLKSQWGEKGLAFSFRDGGWEPGKSAIFDKVKLRLFNPFGHPSQVEVSQIFEAASPPFACDVKLGPGITVMLKAKNFAKAIIQLEVSSTKNALTYQWDIKGHKFQSLLAQAKTTGQQWTHENCPPKSSNTAKPLYPTVDRRFIADPLPKGEKTLKLVANPVYAGQFASAGAGPKLAHSSSAASAGGAAAAMAESNFTVSKVWIAEGCIVCDACEDIYPEVFHVTADTCIVRPDYPKDDGLKVEEAAEACPVEVIKYTKASA